MQIPSTTGSSAGANPRKDEIYRFALLGSVWEVAVFPPISYPSMYASFRSPPTQRSPEFRGRSETSPPKEFRPWNHTSVSPQHFRPRPAPPRRLWGVTLVPPLISEETVVASWIGVIWNDCPKDIAQHNLTDIFFLVHDRGGLSGLIDPCFVHQPKLPEIVAE